MVRSARLTWLLNALMLGLGVTIQELDMSADVTSEELSTTYPIEDHRLDIPDPKSVTYVDYDNPFVLFNQSTGASPHVVQLSKNAWVDCGEGIHVLECLSKGHIRIEPIPGGEHSPKNEMSHV
jgi:ATP-dependent helicase IRC3